MEKLTEEQLRIIQHPHGHALVSAVPGSGKTKTLLHRIEHLIEHKEVEPHKILVLMFNREAKEDFENRLFQLDCRGVVAVDVRTFHSLGFQCLKEWWHYLDLPKKDVCDQYILDTKIKGLINNHLKKLKEKGPSYNIIKKQEVEERLSWINANWPSYQHEDALDYLNKITESTEQFDASRKDVLLELLASVVYFEVMTWLDRTGKISFDQMINLPLDYAEKHGWVPPTLKGISELLVDEYQDANPRQVALLKKLMSASQASIMAVGDADQCIYEWRFATPEFMSSKEFSKFGPFTEYPLTQTFRYGKSLCEAANNLISYNYYRKDQKTVSELDTNTTINLIFDSERLYARLSSWAADKAGGSSALLFRRWDLCIEHQVGLAKRGISFHVLRDNKHFLELDVFKIFRRWLDVVGKSHGELYKTAHRALTETYKDMANQNTINLTMDYISGRSHPQTSKTRTINIAIQLKRVVHSFSNKTTQTSINEFYSMLLTAGLQEVLLFRLDNDEDEAFKQMCMLKDLVTLMASKSISDCFKNMDTLFTNQKFKKGLAMGSIHNSKGLEWDKVAMIGVDEDTFIHANSDKPLSITQLEEQRRLFYVGMTRAKKKLMLSGPEDPNYWCRFVKEARLI